jgi:hypothetical protein
VKIPRNFDGTIMRRLVELEKDFCLTSPEEINMSELTEDLQRRVDTLRFSQKPVAAAQHTCNICFDQSATGLSCESQSGHFIYSDCSTRSAANIGRNRSRGNAAGAASSARGRIKCVYPECNALYSEAAQTRVLPVAIFVQYRVAQDAVIEQHLYTHLQDLYTHLQERFQVELAAARAEFKCANDLA